MKSATRLFILTLLLLVTVICINAQEKVYFTADAPQSVVAGETFRIAYTLNTEVESSAEPYLSETKGFVVLMGPSRSQSSSVEMINGVRTNKSTTTYTYTFQVNGAGDYTIPCCGLRAKNGTYQSNPLPIKVLLNGNKKTESSVTPTDVSSKPTASTSNADMFVQVELSHSSISMNDSLTATVKFYTQRDIISFDKMIFPDFEEFTVQEVSLPEVRQITQERYKGKNYYTAVFQQYILHPKKDGQLTITSGSYTIIVPQKKQQSNKPRDFFDTPKHRADTVTLTSQPVTLMVHPSSDDTSAEQAITVNTIESHADSVKTTDDKLFVESENGKLKFVNDDTRKILLYSSVILLVILFAVYLSKLRATRDVQYVKQERYDKAVTKPSFTWHLSFIAGIILLIGCIVALW